MKRYTVEFVVRATINMDGDDNEFTNDLSDYTLDEMVTLPDVIEIETINEHDLL
jgi:hypothetical protein